MHDNLISETETGNMAVELSCTYDARNKKKSHFCPKLIKNAKYNFFMRAKKYGEDPHQYVNTPSCDNFGKPFGER